MMVVCSKALHFIVLVLGRLAMVRSVPFEMLMAIDDQKSRQRYPSTNNVKHGCMVRAIFFVFRCLAVVGLLAAAAVVETLHLLKNVDLFCSCVSAVLLLYHFGGWTATTIAEKGRNNNLI